MFKTAYGTLAVACSEVSALTVEAPIIDRHGGGLARGEHRTLIDPLIGFKLDGGVGTGHDNLCGP
jgi:hypothetical protein